MKKPIKFFKLSFFKFLDVSGILLGLFLSFLGLFSVMGRDIPGWLGWVVMAIGICAFLLHLGHYFNLKYMRWLFGDNYFIQK
ncbi:hypothetical protein A3F19_00315 [Candidatus Nomurabacteria bacterium RIFCSPHIGHO2_12_FULL_37_29]|uniref:Uncharacterized protein n=2 Tax=Parcubacteria group TaxID=1794811 RepID=A0A1G2UQB5_9BACT|nr:MAG: hypothetical protein A3F19_00315 [Candidatus Nomurabacteria bacterium RIFCSPHIGHO2_12_FULL_37_29]OHB11533.1 MAG: hypothetical protein A3H60_01470 [Candidatus Zambryskibacteria bacterium RIFCSPLOWO2_02_FULL_44_12b]